MLEPCQVSVAHNLLCHLVYVYCTYLNNAKTIHTLYFSMKGLHLDVYNISMGVRDILSLRLIGMVHLAVQADVS